MLCFAVVGVCVFSALTLWFYILLADDHARVVLPPVDEMTDCDSDYINAAYIDVLYTLSSEVDE